MIYEFNKLVAPVGRKRFFEEYKGKKYLVIKGNEIKDHFSWKEFEDYLNCIDMNGHDRMPHFQMVLDGGDKYCKRKTKEQLTKKEIHDYWQSGHSAILTICEFLNKTMYRQCEEFEKVYFAGQSNIYCSGMSEAECFPIHADSTDNYLFHTRGKVQWHLYDAFAPNKGKVEAGKWRSNKWMLDQEPKADVFTLEAGDILYIPRFQYHKVTAIESRISISYHFHEPFPNQRIRKPWLEFVH